LFLSECQLTGDQGKIRTGFAASYSGLKVTQIGHHLPRSITLGACIQMSRCSSVVGIIGIALGQIGATTAFAWVARKLSAR
jgi:hypothetical protein